MRVVVLIAVVAFLLLLLPAWLVANSAIERARDSLIDRTSNAARKALDLRKNELKTAVNDSLAFFQEIWKSKWVTDYLQALHDNADNVGELAETASRELANAAADADRTGRIALLDSTGREILSLGSAEVLSFSLMTTDDLLDHSQEEWFTRLLAAPLKSPTATDVYRKTFPGQTQPVPCVTAAMPFTSSDGGLLGVLIGEVQLGDFFAAAAQRTPDSGLYILNSGHFYLLNPDNPAKNFAFEKGRPGRLSDDFPTSADKMVGNFRLVSPPEKPGWLLVGSSVAYAGPGGPSISLIRAVSIKDSLAPLDAAGNRIQKILITVFPLFFIALLLVFKFTVLDPLRDIAAAVRNHRLAAPVPASSLKPRAVSSELAGEVRALITSGPAAALPSAQQGLLDVHLAALLGQELRTPLSSIKASIDLVQSSLPEDTPEHAVHFLRVCYQSSDSLIRLLDGFLDVARIQAGQSSLSLSKFNVADVTREVLDAVASLAAQNKVQIDSDVPELIMTVADRQKLEQILFHLLVGSVRFARGTWVRLIVQPEATGIRVELSNGGPGVKLPEVRSISDRFAQLETASTEAIASVGLGLAVVKALVNQHRGKISLEAREGPGTRFILDIPLGEIVDA